MTPLQIALVASGMILALFSVLAAFQVARGWLAVLASRDMNRKMDGEALARLSKLEAEMKDVKHNAERALRAATVKLSSQQVARLEGDF